MTSPHSDALPSVNTAPVPHGLRDVGAMAANLPAVLYQFTVSRDGAMAITFVSDAIEELLGIPAALARADWVAALGTTLHADDAAALLESIPRAVSARREWSAEFRARPRGPEVRWFRATGRPRAVEGGALVYDGIIVDVTREQREAAARAESEARLRCLAANMPGVMYQWRQEPDGRRWCTFVSDGARTLLGVEPEAVYLDAGVLHEAVHADDRLPLAEAIDAAFAERRGFVVEFRTMVRGTMRWLRVLATARPEGEDGTVLDAVIVDVSAEKAVARRLAESERRLQAAVDGARDGLWDLDLVADRTWASAQAWHLVGHAPHSIPVSAASWRAHVHPDDAARWREAVATAHADPQGDLGWEGRMRDGGGRWRWLELRGRLLRDEHGAVLRASGTLTDIGARKAAEAALTEARVAAEAANVAKSRFLAQMSHELRTPLNSIIGFARVLMLRLGATMAERERTFLERIHVNGEHLLGIIEEILDVTKVEAGRVAVERRRVDLAVVARDVTAQLEGRVVGGEVALVAEAAAPVWWETDPAKLRQVLINLVGNAIKFTERGSVRVTVRPGTDGEGPTLAVHDTGIGIPADRLDAIFTPFEQGDSGTARRYGGTGLGLSIARSIATLLDAELTVESAVGTGSTFTVRFRVPRD